MRRKNQGIKLMIPDFRYSIFYFRWLNHFKTFKLVNHPAAAHAAYIAGIGIIAPNNAINTKLTNNPVIVQTSQFTNHIFQLNIIYTS